MSTFITCIYCGEGWYPTEEDAVNEFDEIGKLKSDNIQLKEALRGLLDGLDSNYDERCGLTNEEWNERIKDARLALSKYNKV
jgi:hypothetical protein